MRGPVASPPTAYPALARREAFGKYFGLSGFQQALSGLRELARSGL